MANLSITNNSKRLIADTYYKLKKIKSKVQRKASDIGFVKKAIHAKVVPTFAKVKGKFESTNDKWKAEKLILESNLRKHLRDMKFLLKELNCEETKIKETLAVVFQICNSQNQHQFTN